MNITPLCVDTYQGDRHGDVAALMDAGPPWHALVHKLSQGTYHHEVDRVRQFRDVMCKHARYGVDFFDGYYHYVDLAQDPVAQVDYHLARLAEVGGERPGTMPSWYDVERGGQRTIPTASTLWVALQAIAKHHLERTGRRPTLYAGELLRGLGIGHGQAQALGFEWSAIASYTAQLTRDTIERTGTDEAHLAWWQYDGDGEAYLAGFPKEAPGFGKIDISALVLPGGLPALRQGMLPDKTPAAVP